MDDDTLRPGQVNPYVENSLEESINKLRANAEAGWKATERAWHWFRVMTVIAIVATIGFAVSVLWMLTFR